jgi:hypothetical protein
VDVASVVVAAERMEASGLEFGMVTSTCQGEFAAKYWTYVESVNHIIK